MAWNQVERAIQSETGAEGKVKLITLVVELVLGQRDTEIKAQRRSGDEEAQAPTPKLSL